MDGNSLGTVQYGSKISGRSFIGMAVAILDASFQAGVIVQVKFSFGVFENKGIESRLAYDKIKNLRHRNI